MSGQRLARPAPVDARQHERLLPGSRELDGCGGSS
jgi:hypothetical protein